MAAAFIDQLIIECQPGFIRRLFIPIGEDAAPGDGKAEHAEAHFGKHGNILSIAVIEIDALQFQIVFGRMIRDRTDDSFGRQILRAPSFAVFIIRTFTLVGGHCASPKKTCWKCHIILLLFT